MSIAPPDTPDDDTGEDRPVVPAARSRSVAGARTRGSEVERLRAQLAQMPDERWTKA
jgi:hypothetical protein